MRGWREQLESNSTPFSVGQNDLFSSPERMLTPLSPKSTSCLPRFPGLISPGGTVVEGTAGNTGIGLAHVCRSKGYKCVIYMPNTQSQEKIDLLRMLGAEVYPVPGE